MAKKKNRKRAKMAAAVAESSDQVIIQEGYRDGLKQLLLGFHKQCIEGAVDAEGHFKNGLEKLRHVRDCALAIV
jgi:hypothetical protein